jgi:uncharacterized repeat protein (TIGR01451 family)
MAHAFATSRELPQWDRLWRMFLIGLCTLILCSCRGPAGREKQRAVRGGPAAVAQDYPELPPEAYTGAPPQGFCPPPMGPPCMEEGVPLPYQPVGPWKPPGIGICPWPPDEYLCDGGDADLPAGVGKQWEVYGLEVEDTVAHYDTLDGRTLVEPSNRVCVYSPRFGAVRQVTSLVANEQTDYAANVNAPVKVVRHDDTTPVVSAKQNVQAEGRIAARPPIIMRTKQGDGAMSTALGPRGFQTTFKSHEDMAVIRRGVCESAEMAFLAQGVNAAVVWTDKQAVQVILDLKNAVVLNKQENLLTVYTVKEPPPAPQLRLVKVASTAFAEPGDEIDFTLRFDNVGNQAIGNVTIVDSLSTRLEYIPDSAQCSREARFSTEPNDGDSVVLRCELINPLEPGKGGVLRFRCKVR